MASRHVICAVADIPPGERCLFELGGREIGIFNVDGRFYALHNHCPHKGGPLCAGRIGGTALPTDEYAYHYGREGQIIRCAWHGWEFELESGTALADPRVRARTYSVSVEDGRLVITI